MPHPPRSTLHRYLRNLLGIVAVIGCGVLASIAIHVWHFDPNLLPVGVVLLMLALWVLEAVVHRIRRKRHEAKYGKELVAGKAFGDFHAEVLLDGVVVATLSDRVWTEMFWRRYRIQPVNEEGAAQIARDDLWENCRFTFRHPETGLICDTGFAGGSAPFVREEQISLRALYFRRAPEETACEL